MLLRRKHWNQLPLHIATVENNFWDVQMCKPCYEIKWGRELYALVLCIVVRCGGAAVVGVRDAYEEPGYACTSVVAWMWSVLPLFLKLSSSFHLVSLQIFMFFMFDSKRRLKSGFIP